MLKFTGVTSAQVFGLNKIKTATQNTFEINTLKSHLFYIFFFAFEGKKYFQMWKLTWLKFKQKDMNISNRTVWIPFLFDLPILRKSQTLWKRCDMREVTPMKCLTCSSWINVYFRFLFWKKPLPSWWTLRRRGRRLQMWMSTGINWIYMCRCWPLCWNSMSEWRGLC